jgi:hypothetical protein
MSEQEQAKAPAWLGLTRVGIGLAQGLALFWLHRATDLGYWPATEPALFGALALVLVFTPLILIGGLNALRPVTLVIWVAVAIALLGWMGWHDLDRGMRPDYRSDSWPQFATYAAAAAIVFIAHHLIAVGDEAQKWIGPYERYFDQGWRHAAQLVLSCAFTGAFWVLLFLGAALFNIIKITLVEEIIRKDWFYYPATTMAFAIAIHLTDLRSGLVRGFRALSLMLLSWLMPVLTVLGAAFLVALPFTGLDPLWQTRAAGAILLSAAANLIILINAAYQDGGADTSRWRVLRVAARIAAAILVPFVVLAGVALYLRVAQHGWSPERIYAAALILIGACYAFSYLAAAFWRPWLKLIERANIATACVVLVVLAVLFTPIFDPARISVAQQLERLRSERVTAEEFDYIFLQFDSGTYGRDAAQALEADHSTPRAREIAGRMEAVRGFQSRWEAENATRPNDALQARAARAAERPTLQFTLMAGSDPLPEGFLRASENLYGGPLWRCRQGRAPCEARTINLDDDAQAEVLVVLRIQVAVFDVVGEEWEVVQQGTLCSPSQREDLRAGRLETRPRQYRDIVIGGSDVDMRRDNVRCVEPFEGP